MRLAIYGPSFMNKDCNQMSFPESRYFSCSFHLPYYFIVALSTFIVYLFFHVESVSLALYKKLERDNH